MDTQRQEFRIGIMVLTCLVCLTLMTILFGKLPTLNLGGEANTVLVRFQRSPGVKTNTPVFKNGVQVGRVTRVELVENDQQVQVSIILDRNRRIYTDEECRIRQNFVMGDAFLEFVKRLNFTGKVEEIDPSAVPYLVGVDSSDLMSGFGNIEGDLTRAVQNVADAADQFSSLIERVNVGIGTPAEFQVQKERFEAIVQEVRQTMYSMRQTTDGINQFVNDPEVQGNVRKVVNDLPEVIEHSRTLIGETTHFVQNTRGLIEKGSLSLDSMGAGLDKITQTLDSITNIVSQVESDIPETVAAIRRSAVRLESLFGELTMIVENFRQADGSVKRLIRDPEAYEKLMATLDNVERITEEVDRMLRVDAKPIVHNVKILTDKAARDPAVFIRNLMRKEPPVKPGPFMGTPFMLTSYMEASQTSSFVSIPCCSDRVMPATPVRRLETQSSETVWIDDEPFEFVSETPVRIERLPREGRIVNVDPRYQD